MKVLAITSLLVALAAVASATPIEERQVDIDVPLEQQADVVARAQPGAAADQTSKALVCTDKYFRRDCKILRRPAGECGEFQAPFDNAISSIQPYKGFKCTFWVDHKCSQGQNKDALRDIDFKIDNLSTYAGGRFNDRFSSWKCGPV